MRRPPPSRSGPRRRPDRPARRPQPLRKLNALYYEFVETGIAAQFGYQLAGRSGRAVSAFFWSQVEPYLATALEHLERTVAGKQWIAQLYAHVFVEEHKLPGRGRSGRPAIEVRPGAGWRWSPPACAGSAAPRSSVR